jgi:hypothetical protein
MKIQLERNLKVYPHRLRCVACQHRFYGGSTRVLLRHQHDEIVGDVCVDCIEHGTKHIQQQLKQRAIELFKQPAIADVWPSPQKQALELWELATGDLVIPPFYYWWWQRLLILVGATQELEVARRGKGNFRSGQSKLPKITFTKEESSFGKDN